MGIVIVVKGNPCKAPLFAFRWPIQMSDDEKQRATARDALSRGVLERVTLRGPATDAEVVAAVGASLPEDYVAFLRVSDGGEGWIGNHFIEISGLSQAMDTTKGFAEFIPDLFFFGSDGAEAGFAFDMRDAAKAVVITHFEELDMNGVVRLADSFTKFLQFLRDESWSEVWAKFRTGK